MQGPLTRVAILALAAGASLASAIALPGAASAQTYGDYRAYQDCRSQQAGNAVGGAIVGGLIGGVIGNSVAGRGDRGAGTAVGAGVGAAVGAGVGSSSTNCYDGPTRYDYNRSGYDYDRGDYRYDDGSYRDDRRYQGGSSYPGYYQTDPDYPTGPYGGDSY